MGATREERAREEFLAELWEITERVERDLGQLDPKGPSRDPARVQSMFRAAHTLKGLAGVYGLDAVAREAHGLEDQLDDLRMERVRFDANSLDRLYARVETVRAGLRAAHGDRGFDAPVSVTATLDPGLASRLTDYEQHRVARALSDGRAIHCARWEAALDDVDPTLDALRAALGASGEHIATLSTARDDLSALRLEVIVASAEPAESLRSRTGRDVETLLRAGPSVRDRVVSRGAPLPVLFPTMEDSLSLSARVSPSNMPSAVRVDIGRLDALLDVVSELAALRATLPPEAARAVGDRVERLQHGLLALRLVPLGQVFERLSREVRSLARTLERRVHLEVTGAETTLDKVLAEEVVPALVHLVRNAVDHGIEDSATRVARGKSGEGRVRVDAWSSGREVGIAVEDDGVGIDPDAVRARAAELGLTGEGDPMAWLFLPGFTLRRTVTSTSGRGVGLDAVRTSILRLGGVVSIQSRAGEGTRVTLTLPMTLAVQPCVLLDLAGERYALPASCVRAVVDGSCDERSVTVDGQELAVHDLGQRFGLATSASRVVVMASHGDRAAGLRVDAVSAVDDVVVKRMPRGLAGVRGFAGVTDVGGGRLALVLDPGSLLASLDEAVAR